jgi:hypothetical protein
MALISYSHDDKWSELFQEPYTKIVNNKSVKFSDVLVHSFSMSDVEDPDLYAGQPLIAWQESEAGVWVMLHAADKPYWVRRADPYNYGFRYYVFARLTEPDQIYWQLKWGNKNDS